MGNSKIDMNILAKRVELLEMRVKELTSVEPEALNERLSKIEERYFSNKEMLTTTEVAEYLGVSQSQIYKLTMNMEIPHYKPQGKTIYFDKKELLKWMRNNHIAPARKDSANKYRSVMKDRKKNKTRVYSDVQLTALLEKSEIVIDPSKCRNQNERSNGKRKKQ